MSFQRCVRGFSECADLPRPVPVQRYRKGSNPGSHHRAGHRDLQTGVPHRHGSGARDRGKSRAVRVFIGQKLAKHMTYRQEEGEKDKQNQGSPMPTEHSYPGLDVGAEDTETPQCGQRGQQHGQGERLQSRSETHEELKAQGAVIVTQTSCIIRD